MNKDVNEILSQQVTRREFVGNTTKTCLAATIAGSIPIPFSAQATEATVQLAESEEIVRHSACLVNCGSRCALKVIVKDDRVIRIEPEESPDDSVYGKHQIRPCLRGRASRWRIYHPDRIKYPMVREGKRGEGKFKRVSWEEATKLVAQKLKDTITKYGNESIYYNYQSGAYYHTQGTPAWHRLLNLSGGFLRYYNNYSNAQVMNASVYTLGEYSASHFEQVKHSDLVVFFGLNLSETRMSGGGQIEEFRRAQEISKARVIIIDPRYTDSVVSENAEWIAIKPTTDAALVNGIVYTLITENLINEEMVNKYCVGYDASTLPESAPKNGSYKDHILGNGEDKTPKTPEWAEEITGVSATRIRQLAREIASAKACFIAQGWGLQRHANGEQSVRAILSLPLLTGHFGLPGTNNGNWAYSTSYGVPKLPVGNNPIQTAIPCYLWTEAIAHPEVMTDKTHGVRNAEKLNVGIKFMLNQAGNVLINQHGDIHKTCEILADESLCETILVIDNHMTPSAMFADILLPETSYLEAEDLVDSSYASGSYSFMIAMQKAINPLWEVRSTYDICADIAEHLGLKEAFTEGLTQTQWMERHYATVKESRPYLPEWEKAKDMGVIDQQLATEKQSIILAGFREDPMANPLKTPSGKAEIYSEALAKIASEWVLPEGDKITPVPEFYALKESHLDKEMLKKYPLQLIGFHTKGHTHSTYTNVPQLAEAHPDEIWINPVDAKARNIHSGDRIEIFNDRGLTTMPAKVTSRIMPGVVGMPQGAWFKPNEKGVDTGGCINVLTSLRVSPLAKGNPQHTNLVEIKKA